MAVGSWISSECAKCTVARVVRDEELAREVPDTISRIYQVAVPLQMNAFIVRGGPSLAASIAPLLVGIHRAFASNCSGEGHG